MAQGILVQGKVDNGRDGLGIESPQATQFDEMFIVPQEQDAFDDLEMIRINPSTWRDWKRASSSRLGTIDRHQAIQRFLQVRSKS
jgi:hypothetical protein